MDLPSCDVIPQVTKNKQQLINLIMEYFRSNADKIDSRNKIIIIGNDPIPFQITGGVIEDRVDLKTTQEEADTILIHQVTAMGTGKAVVISDDTDVFVLLLHFLFSTDIKVSVFMQPTSAESDKVIDINATYQKHIEILPNILRAHAASGCDTVGSCYGIGKLTIVKVLQNNNVSLASIGDLTSPCSLLKEGTEFLMMLWTAETEGSYRSSEENLEKHVSQNQPTALKLESLPPTDDAFHENLKRAHIQVAIWRTSLKVDPPEFNLLDFGWVNDIGSPCLLPSTVSPSAKLIPDDLLKIIRCGCSSQLPCKTQRCTCTKSGLSCSSFCDCEGGITCCNPSTPKSDDYIDGH